MVEPIVTIENLSFTYPSGERKALDNINLNINKGEFVVVMGANGAGKTTLCLSLNGVIPQLINGTYTGKIVIDGMQTTKHAIYSLAQKVGITLQDPESQLLAPNVKSEVIFGPENLGIPKEEILRRLAYALKVTRLEEKQKASPLQLSGGQKQRLALACAISMQTSLLVLDEPTSQLDPIGTTEVFSVVKDLNKKLGITVIMTEHKSEEIADFADRVILMHEGRVVADGKPDEVFKQAEIFNSARVKLPQVCQVFHWINEHDKIREFPTTLEDGVSELSKLFEEKRIHAKKGHIIREKTERSDNVILEARDLSHTYPPNVVALKNINLKVYQGEFVALIGQNGAGKTTLVKHFVGLLRPTKGSILIDGADIAKKRPAEISREIGLVLQNPDHQLFEQSGEEEIAFGPKNLGLPAEEVKKRVDESIKLVGLESQKTAYPFRLSFGDRRKLAVAAIYAMKPKVFILDEPTTGQDFQGRYDIVEIAKNLNKQGNTIIMITHDMELVTKYTTRTVVLGNGEIILDGPTHEVFEKTDVLQSTFLKPPQIGQLAQALKSFGVPPNVITVDEFRGSIDFRK
jgi:energy-coupling factor transport system ATP-binding protein